ncbi:HAMP domain-containing protein [Geitlerinema sp. P-1104]|uniref:adenylate/guanylate cyclase domain-containing protein n=1 Tax=Geitlerinema sp. P-1104 TaxID=2546230 RepID=UPI001476DB4A|nr:adenylate/guanylate cyclase domain-containing protein [Geitlerinema sp. P-1104]NMG57507.1 HAMP domain-containing protein [Geitlerinema sp. P-1104]
MKLYKKTLILISFSLFGLIAILYGSIFAILLESFGQLETKNATRDIQRVENALRQKVAQLNLVTGDWSNWDAMYNFIAGENEQFVEENLTDTVLTNLKLRGLLLIDREGEVKAGYSFELAGESGQPPRASWLERLTPEHPLLAHDSRNSLTAGFWVLPEETLLVSSRPILTSGGGGVMPGTLIMLRHWDEAQVQELAEDVQLQVRFHRLSALENSRVLQAIARQLQDEPDQPAIKPLNEQELAGYHWISDIYGTPELLLEVTMPRDVHREGRRALGYLLGSLLLVGGVFGVLTVILLERLVLRRLARLSEAVSEVGKSSDLTLRVSTPGTDELSDLGASINGMLEDLEKNAAALAQERETVERLLLNVLPESIAARLKVDEGAIAELFDDVTILFADIVGFTPLSLRLTPVEVVNLLNQIFSEFDAIAEKLGLEKIKTIGDAYMVAGGLPIPRADHAEAIADMALAMLDSVDHVQEQYPEEFQIRLGINSGTVVAGVIGTHKFIYDLWGDTVNVASRMESHGEPGKIQVTEATYERLKERYTFQDRGMIALKGRGEMKCYWLTGKKS